ncbi:FAD-dependent oxidoreductase [Aeromicrobium sp. IC_218]|uniref:FAD-dependent oxidoreductase n=1 Tax=Aeromicrobium sp. IC_218 TaxID=2545468 RepID=UPI00103E616F|nr:FAD-dependent oxidoreductase [Aeromicrobium sp. IC_218]TCJ00812.1 FAD-dependent oxidoreductase [Aeromicrobium sp. IC_218]
MPDLPLPVVVIGAGPIGLATAAHLRGRGLDVLVLERGERAGAAVREWSHVRLFSPWSELVDPAARTLLTEAGWIEPELTAFPTGGDWAEQYLQPLADALGDAVRYGHQVVGVTRLDRDVMVDSGRDDAPFVVHVRTPEGESRLRARTVVDASGTWSGPNPFGGDGLPAVGESAHADRIAYRVPDLRDGATAQLYAGRHTVVAGTGASAKTALVELTRLARSAPGTRVTWIVRRPSVGDAFGGGEDDQLSERGALGTRARAAVGEGPVATRTGFRTESVTTGADGRLVIASTDGQSIDEVDRVIAVTGFRPDLTFLSEVRLDLDPRLQAPSALAPLIDPNVHSCGTVYPHGAAELTQPDPGFFLVGMKSYGRAPSFLALTGYEQARSVAAAIAGDQDAAARVELVLPETGVCGGAASFDEDASGGCCSSPIELIELGPVPTPRH